MSEGTDCFEVSANSIGVFWIPCSFKLFVYFILFSGLLADLSTPRSVQNTFKSAFYTNRFDKLARLILLRQISCDNFLENPFNFKSTIFSNTSRVSIFELSTLVQILIYLFLAYPASSNVLCPHKKMFFVGT